MSTKNSPEADNLGAEDDDAGSEIDVSRIPLADDLGARLDRIEQRCRELGWLP